MAKTDCAVRVTPLFLRSTIFPAPGTLLLVAIVSWVGFYMLILRYSPQLFQLPLRPFVRSGDNPTRARANFIETIKILLVHVFVTNRAHP